MKPNLFAYTAAAMVAISTSALALSLSKPAEPAWPMSQAAPADTSRVAPCTNSTGGRDCHIHTGQAFLANPPPDASQPHALQEYERMQRAYSGPDGRR